MARQIASLVGATCAAYLPGDNHLYKHLIGTAVSELIITSITKLQQTRLGQWVSQRRVRPQRKYELAIHDHAQGAQHRLYTHLEQLLVSRGTRNHTATQARLAIDASGQMNMRHDLKSRLALIKRGQSNMLSRVEMELKYESNVLYVSAVPPNLRVARWQSPEDVSRQRNESERESATSNNSNSGPPIWLSSDTIDLKHMELFLTNVVKKPRRYELLITDDASIEHIYDELQEWILARCHDSLYKGRADSKRGRLTVLPMVMNQAVESEFEKHDIQVSLGAPKSGARSQTRSRQTNLEDDEADNDVSSHAQRPPIWVVSRTAPIEVLQRFLFTIVNVEKPRVAKQLRVHRWIVTNSRSRKRERDNARWVTEYTLTNKTIANTIVAERVERELYDDVRKFLGAESYYAKKGLPWKRGYFLHGPPGTGKTSVIKAIANEFNLDIFSVDMACIGSDSELIALTTDISQKKKGKNYIVAFEDVDRSNFFKRGRNSNISKQCMLNVLDGISESYGRVLFFTGNHPNNVMRMPAMVRPGRIDCCIPVDFVTPKQLARLLAHFYDDLEEATFVEAHLAEFEQRIRQTQRPLSPAAVMEAMLKHDTEWQDACRELFGGHFDTNDSGAPDNTPSPNAESESRALFEGQHIGTYRGHSFGRRRQMGKTSKLIRMECREKAMAKQLETVESPQFHERLDTLRTQIEAQRTREKERQGRTKQRERERRQRERNKQQKKKKEESNAKKVVRMAKQLETLKTRLATTRQKRKRNEGTPTGAVSARALRAAKRAKC